MEFGEISFLLYRQAEGAGNHLIEIPDCLWAKPLTLTLAFYPFHLAHIQQILVEALQVQCGKLPQRDPPNGGLDVVVDITR